MNGMIVYPGARRFGGQAAAFPNDLSDVSAIVITTESMFTRF